MVKWAQVFSLEVWDSMDCTEVLEHIFYCSFLSLKMRLDFIPSLEGDDDYICNLIKMHVILLLALNILSYTDLCVVHRDKKKKIQVLQHSLEHFLTTQNEEAILILTFNL